MRWWTTAWLVAMLGVVSMPQSALAASGDVMWTRTFGTRHDSGANSVVAHPGGVYVVGRINDTVTEAGTGTADAFIRSYSAGGTLLWSRTFRLRNGWTGDTQTSAYDVATDSSGVYVVGSTRHANENSNSDLFVRKYTHGGTHVWTRFIAGRTSSSTEFPGVIAVDGTGVYVSGNTDGSLPGYTNAGDTDVFVRKYTTGGTHVWTRQMGTPSFEEVTDITLDPWGVLVVGSTDGTWPGQSGAGDTDMYVRKYTRSGGLIWTRQFGTAASDYGGPIDTVGASFYVAGTTHGTLAGQTSKGRGDAFVRKYRGDGRLIWTRQFGTSSDETAGSLDADTDRVYLTGHTSGAFAGFTNRGDYDVFVTSFSDTGVRGWTRQFGTQGWDHPNGLALGFPPGDTQQDDRRGLYVGGFLNVSSDEGGYAFVRKYEE